MPVTGGIPTSRRYWNSVLRIQPAVANASLALRDRALPAVQLAIALLLSTLAGYAVVATGSWQITFGAVGVGGLFALGFLRPALFLGLFLLIRPLLDELSHITLGVPSANPSGGMALMVVVLAVALLATTPGVMRSPPSLAFGLVVLITAGGAGLAMFDFGQTIGTEPLSDTVRIAALLGMYLLVANVFCSPERVRQLFVVVGLSGVAPAVLGLVELISGPEVAEHLGLARISGPFGGPNPLGMYCALTALVLIAMPRRWLPWWGRMLALAPILVALVATYSRAGWVVFLLGLLLLEWRRNKVLVLSAIVVVAAVVALVPTVKERVIPSNKAESSSPETYESFGWRVDNWADLLAKASKKPIVGYGTKTTIYVNPRRTTGAQTSDNGGFEAHNAVVRILVEGGVVLLAAYVFFMALLFRMLYRLTRDRWRLQVPAKIVAVLWLVFTILAVGADDPFDQTAIMFALFALTAALDGASQLEGASARRAARRRRPDPALAHAAD